MTNPLNRKMSQLPELTGVVTGDEEVMVLVNGENRLVRVKNLNMTVPKGTFTQSMNGAATQLTYSITVAGLRGYSAATLSIAFYETVGENETEIARVPFVNGQLTYTGVATVTAVGEGNTITAYFEDSNSPSEIMPLEELLS